MVRVLQLTGLFGWIQDDDVWLLRRRVRWIADAVLVGELHAADVFGRLSDDDVWVFVAVGLAVPIERLHRS